MSYLQSALILASAHFLMAPNVPDEAARPASLAEISAPQQAQDQAAEKTPQEEVAPEVQAFENFLVSHNIQLQPIAFSAQESVEPTMIMAFDGSSGCIQFDARNNMDQLTVASFAMVTAAREIESRIATGQLPSQIRSAHGVYAYNTQTGELHAGLSMRNDFVASSICSGGAATGVTASDNVPDEDFSDLPPAAPLPVRTIIA